MKTLLKGLWIGATMTVPGVSGGTMAVVIGIYEKLIMAISDFKNNPKKHMGFLLRFVVGALTGFVLFARGINYLLENDSTGETVRFLFCGIVAGGVPFLVEKSEVKKLGISTAILLLAGSMLVFSITFIPTGLFSTGTGITGMMMQFAGGIVVAIALILPGISVSHMLYILGLYQWVLECVYKLDFIGLIPLAAGVIIGCIVTAKILNNLLDRYTTAVYLVIIGFVAGSVTSLIPKNIVGFPVLGILMLIVGAVGMYFFTMKQGKINK